MTDIYTIAEKLGLAIAVILLINLQVLPELRAIRREILALTFLIAKQGGISMQDALDWLDDAHPNIHDRTRRTPKP
jgi:hypothetical protein